MFPGSLDPARPFTRAVALAAGLTSAELRSSAYRVVVRGVYVRQEVEITRSVRLQAALLLHPASAYASHASAAGMYRLPVTLTGPEHVSVTHRSDRRRVGTYRHHLAPPDARIRRIDGVRVSGASQLFCELAGELGLVNLVVAGDTLVRRHGVTPEQLCEAAARAPRAVRRAAVEGAAYVRPGVDSPMESRLRMLIVLAGLPEPTVDHRVLWSDGRVRFRFDLSYPAYQILIEYDGRQHRDDLDQWDIDLGRRDWMDAHGWQFVPVVARGIYQRPDETLERILAALKRAGHPASRARLRDEWRQYFPMPGRAA